MCIIHNYYINAFKQLKKIVYHLSTLIELNVLYLYFVVKKGCFSKIKLLIKKIYYKKAVSQVRCVQNEENHRELT